LLQGYHPAPNPKKVTESDGKWKRWAESGDRILDDIKSSRVRRIVERCLDSDPGKRPDALGCIFEICEELKEIYKIDIASTLAEWRKPAIEMSAASLNEYHAWAGANSILLSPAESKVSRNQVLKKLQQIDVIDFETCEAWMPLADTFIKLSCSGSIEASKEVSKIRKSAAHYFVSILGAFDELKMSLLPKRQDWPKGIRPFERFSIAIKSMANLAQIPLENDSEVLKRISCYARSALMFNTAVNLRMQAPDKAIDMLARAIDESPNEPTNYYFRALWRKSLKNHQSILSSSKPLDLLTPEMIEQDLQKAASLAPDWEEPIKMLKAICKNKV